MLIVLPMSLRSALFALALLLGAPFANAAGPSFDIAPPDTRPHVELPAAGWSIERGLYADVYGPAGEGALVRRLANHAATMAPILIQRLGVRPGGTLDIYVLDDQAEFQRLQPGRIPDWADGTAWPKYRLIFLRAPNLRANTADPVETVLTHELVHALLGPAFGGRDVPTWLQEGLAQFYAGESNARALAMARGDYGGGSFSLSQLTDGFPINPAGARLAYAQSADFIGFVAGHSGDAGLQTLVRHLAAGETTDAALRAAIGMSLSEADAAWRKPTENIVWTRHFMNPGLWGAAGAVLLGVAAYRRTRRGKLKLERWEEEERLQAARRLAEIERQREQAELQGLRPRTDDDRYLNMVPYQPNHLRQVQVFPSRGGPHFRE